MVIVVPDHHPRLILEKPRMNNTVNLTRADDFDSQCPREVEKRLRQVSKKLAETEINIGLFKKMARNSVPTGDVRHFVLNQAEMKQSSSKVHFDVIRKIMRSKLNDACGTANKLRQKKRKLKRLLGTRFDYTASKHRDILKEVAVNTANHKSKHKIKSDKKFRHCNTRMSKVISDMSLRGIPESVWEVARGVNIFKTDVVQEECADPMICSKNIKLSPDEMNFLRKGPKYMMRVSTNDTDFLVELEKMVVKDKYEASSDGRSDSFDGYSDQRTSVFNSHSMMGSKPERCAVNKDAAVDEDDDKLAALAEDIEARAGMIYIKKDKMLNLGKLRATNYKFNKYVCLPKPETAHREAVHEIRKAEMLKIFKKTVGGKVCKDPGLSKRNLSSTALNSGRPNRNLSANIKEKVNVSGAAVSPNLTPSEQRGLKSLQERVRNKELVVTETDKSRRFCILEKAQYELSGKKHTDKDVEISHDQLHSIQKLVNDHGKWLKKIFKVGLEWNHEERIANSMTDKGEVVGPLYLLIKDHKSWSEEDGTPPPSRPICSGNVGFNRHISELLSMILEPLGHALGGADIDSTGGLLSKITELNTKLESDADSCDRETGASNKHPSFKNGSHVTDAVKDGELSSKPKSEPGNSDRGTSAFNKHSSFESDGHGTGVFNRYSSDGRGTGVFNRYSSNTPVDGCGRRTGAFNRHLSGSSVGDCGRGTGSFNCHSDKSSCDERGRVQSSDVCSRGTGATVSARPTRTFGHETRVSIKNTSKNLNENTQRGESSRENDDDLLVGNHGRQYSLNMPSELNKKSEPDPNTFSREFKLKRSEKLRELKVRGTQKPNIKAKLWALRLQDEALGQDAVTLPMSMQNHPEATQQKASNTSSTVLDIPPMQASRKERYTIVGNDVEALYPSLLDIESARITRQAVLMADLQIDNFDYELGLKYLLVTGGKSHLEEIGLGKVAPRWLGSRQDLLTVGGESMEEPEKWSKLKRELTSGEKKQVLARVVEAAVLICMSTHVYSFNGNLYIQCKGGPIGMRFTASLASVIMKFWDLKWIELLKRENVVYDLYLRYVDDCRLFLPVFNKGWLWKDNRLMYSAEQHVIDNESDETDVARTTRIITNAMCSLTSFLKFTGEDSTMFPDETLPTLDTTLWIENNRVKHMFYEKPTVGNRVLIKDTALPIASIRSSLLQETVRRLQNCSLDLDICIIGFLLLHHNYIRYHQYGPCASN